MSHFYSANDWSDDSYTVVYATASSITGPFTKRGRIVSSANDRGPMIGHGGQELVWSRGGKDVHGLPQLGYGEDVPSDAHRLHVVRWFGGAQRRCIVGAAAPYPTFAEIPAM